VSKRWMLLAVVAVLSVGCGGGESAREQAAGSEGKGLPSAPDACQVLTADDIQQVLAVSVQGKPLERLEGISTTSTCSYTATEGEQNVVSLLIQVGTSDDPQANLKNFVISLTGAAGTDYQLDPVEGLSAPAIWNPDMRQLVAFQGYNQAIFTMYDTAGQDPVETAKALAGKVLPRM
jgi:hypothetical protein